MNKSIQADLILVIVAIIWGVTFVAQRMGMEHIGPFGFNACRFILGAISLLPLLFIQRFKTHSFNAYHIISGSLAGVVLFAGASFQQAGLIYTTAGNAGFITGLYIVLVPLLGLLLKQRTSSNTWVGALVAVVGLYLLSFKDISNLNVGDMLVLCSAMCWAIHVLLIAKLAPKTNNLYLAVIQFVVCAGISAAAALTFETTFTPNNIAMVWGPIFFAGFISVAIAYTLQIVAQRSAPPAHAAIIMSLETVVAALAGWWILQESFTTTGVVGCALMLVGMLISQLNIFKRPT